MTITIDPSQHLTLKQKEINKNVLGGESRYAMLVGGARSGKTFLLCRAIALRMMRYGGRHVILRQAFNHVKASIWHDTMPKMMEVCFPGVVFKQNKADWFWEYTPNKGQIWIGGLDEKERTEKILGTEYVTIYLNEASQIPWTSVEMVQTRLAQMVPGCRQKLYVDCNPPLTSHWTNRLFVEKREPVPPYKQLVDPDNYAWARINPEDNRANLSTEYLNSLERLPARQRRRFWEGLWGSDTENALWTTDLIEKYRVRSHPDLQRIVIGVDPSGTKGPEEAERSDHVGIVVVGLGIDGEAYVLEDLTAQCKPQIWGKRVVTAYKRYEADCIVAETNFGGAMVAEVIRSASAELRSPINYKEVHASRGKVIRAEPISTLYDQGKVHHVGSGFFELETQLCNFTSAGYMGDRSPDRADALIWALSDLFPGMTRKVPKRKMSFEGVDSYNPQRY
jgi:PBSX family phage terminase large subunit